LSFWRTAFDSKRGRKLLKGEDPGEKIAIWGDYWVSWKHKGEEAKNLRGINGRKRPKKICYYRIGGIIQGRTSSTKGGQQKGTRALTKRQVRMVPGEKNKRKN